jgi:hypothetical protein
LTLGTGVELVEVAYCLKPLKSMVWAPKGSFLPKFSLLDAEGNETAVTTCKKGTILIKHGKQTKQHMLSLKNANAGICDHIPRWTLPPS